METLSNLALGFTAAVTPTALLYCFIGVFLGTLVGVLPGIGALAAISLLLPITYHIDAASAIIMLAGVYYGTGYGGSTAAILLNLPGVPSSAVACIDGYPMAKQGRAGVALFLTTIASLTGAMIGLLMLILFAPVIADIGLRFGPAEYVALMILGLLAASLVSSGSALKGIAMVLIGLLFGTVGTDVNSGVARFNFGSSGLIDGLSLVALAMGLFGVSELINSSKEPDQQISGQKITLRSMIPTRTDMRQAALPMLRGSAIGSFLGALPGVGPTLASFISYATERRLSRHPEKFGHGAVEGLSSAEASNNAAIQTGFVPSLALGVPGDAVMALMLAALILHGITPGPLFMTQQPEVFWGLIVSFVFGNIILVILNIPTIGLWVRLLSIPYRLLYPAIVVIICLGALSVHNNTFDIVMVAAFGLLGYLMMLLGFQPAPLLLGFVLGPLLEVNLARTLLLSRGSLTVFIERPISASLLAAAAIIVSVSVFSAVLRRRKRK